MKKSAQVPASLIVALAASVVAGGGCQSRNAAGQCVDAQGRILPDSACRNGGTPGAHWIQTGGFGSGNGGGFFGG